MVRERQGQKCGCGHPQCDRSLEGLKSSEIEFDHWLEIWEFGPDADPDEVNALDNFRCLVKKPCHQRKSAQKAKERAKMKRNRAKHAGTFKKSGRKLKGRSSFDSWLGMDGTVRRKKP